MKLAVSGVGLRRIGQLLDCAKQTVQDKVSHLAYEAEKAHTQAMQQLANKGGTAYIMMDELETFIHAQWAQVSVPVVVRVKTGEILGFGVAKMSSKMKKGQQMGWTTDTRSLVIPRLLDQVLPVLNPAGATIKTDGGTSYGKWIQKHLPGVVHEVGKSPGGKDEYDPLFAINHTHAKMRSDLARLGRKSWSTTKSINALTEHLWLWVAWTNGYRLK